MISILRIVHDTMVDGPGFRTSVYCAGCPNHCPACHNPQSWDIENGTMTSTEDILREIMEDPFANVTFSGGDPMFQPEGFTELALAIRRVSKKDIWCFTGFLFENLLQNPKQRKLLEQIDVLVDGPFIQAKRDPDLFFRGSSNQRIINVQKSLQTGQTVVLELTEEHPTPEL
jgi:anaerobic ribonucleoside-triphosphate reductase activating protein